MSNMHICAVCEARDDKDSFTVILRCDFCLRTQYQVRWLVKGGHGADICDECIADAQESIPPQGDRSAKRQDREGGLGPQGESAGPTQSDAPQTPTTLPETAA